MDRVVFNIAGNKYRLIVRINYYSKTVSQFQKSVVVIPAKAGYEVKHSAIQYFRFFYGHRLSPV
ncbi:MAG: hypothetical protein C0403_10960 [Desulfobacterium sp.]|nr:hypothetical protein [Desulfobacterium sp.]